MKEQALPESKDLCQPSLDILRQKCVEWFARNGLRGPVHFPDRDELLFGEETEEVVNVVFFGSFLKRFLESSNWTPRRYRFWVPCEATRDVLTQLLGIPSPQIGIIPRYELIAPATTQREFPRDGERFTLIFAGRLSPNKNVEMLVKTVSFLQTEQKVPVELVLAGRFDNEFHVDRDPLPISERMDYRERILKTIREMKWTVPPRLLHDLGPDEWYRQKFVNPVFASLSTFICEDFGVSAAQAQAQGWPCLLSEWGGHREVRGPGVRLIPVPLIGVYETGELITLKARQLAGVIRGLFEEPGRMRAGSSIPKGTKVRPPSIVKISDLDSIRRDLVDQLGRGAHLISRGEIYCLGDTPSGAVFFSKYRQLFSGPVPDASNVVLVNNLHETTTSPSTNRVKHVGLACRLIANAAAERGATLTFASAQEIYHMDTLALLLQAERVVLPFFIEEMLPMCRFLQRMLPPQVPFTLLALVPPTTEGRRARDALTKLRAAMRDRDQILEFATAAELARWIAGAKTSKQTKRYRGNARSRTRPNPRAAELSL